MLMSFKPSVSRSVAKAVTYRLVIMCADALAIYLFTGKWTVALGFMLASNVYTTVLYFAHERVWARIPWGRGGTKARPAPSIGAGLRAMAVGGDQRQERRQP